MAGFFSIPVWVLVYYFAFRRQPTDLAGIRKARNGHRYLVLVVADQGLEHPAIVEEVTRRGERAETEVMIVVPVVASSPSHALADQIDHEARTAERRLQRVIGLLTESGILARGHVNEESDPMQALLDVLREFPANEVVLVLGAEHGWPEAEVLGERNKAGGRRAGERSWAPVSRNNPVRRAARNSFSAHPRGACARRGAG